MTDASVRFDGSCRKTRARRLVIDLLSDEIRPPRGTSPGIPGENNPRSSNIVLLSGTYAVRERTRLFAVVTGLAAAAVVTSWLGRTIYFRPERVRSRL
jgi:hypothetical protein